MAINLLFTGTIFSKTSNKELKVTVNNHSELLIQLFDDSEPEPSYICLDKRTAVKLHKELKRQISLIEEY